MDFISAIANQGGSGWLLFSGSLVVLGVRETMHANRIKEKDAIILDISEKRVKDATDGRDINSRNIEGLRTLMEPMYVILQNLQNIANKGN
jgi:hypothetical protein